MGSGLERFGRYSFDGVRFDTIEADYMVQDGVVAKLYKNRGGSANEDELIAVINTGSGHAVIQVSSVSAADDPVSSKS